MSTTTFTLWILHVSVWGGIGGLELKEQHNIPGWSTYELCEEAAAKLREEHGLRITAGCSQPQKPIILPRPR